MRPIDETLQKTATYIAPELDRLIEAYLSAGMMMGGKEYLELTEFLWSNKKNLLRVTQAVSHACSLIGKE